MAGVPQRRPGPRPQAVSCSGAGGAHGSSSGCSGARKDRSDGTVGVAGGGDTSDESEGGIQTDPTAHAAALCRVLGLPAPRLMALVGRCPDLFAFSPAALEATLEAVAALTGLQRVVVPQLVAADPGLLLAPDRLKGNMRELGQVLQVPPTEVVNMAAREPAVLALGGAEAAARLEALAAALLLAGRPALPLRHSQLVEAVLAAPGALLAPPPEAIQAQLEALEAALAPLLPTEELEEVTAQLEPASASAAAAASAAAEAAPLSASPSPSPTAPPASTSSVDGPLPAASPAPSSSSSSSSPPSPWPPAATAAHEHQPPQPHQPPQSQQPQPPQKQHHVLPLRALTAPLVLAKPSLLATPPELVAGRVAHLAAKARISAAQVLLAAPAGPNLLAASSCHIDRHCAAMAASLGTALRFPPPPPPPPSPQAPASATTVDSGHARRQPQRQQQHSGQQRRQLREVEAARAYAADPEAAAAAALVAEPRLLAQHVNAVAAKWQLLAAIGSTSAVWAARLKAATVAERAELLVLPYTHVARLRFLADRDMQDAVDLVAAVRLSDALFHFQFPGFREWLRS
ncbi:hypothetical protein HYH02_009618 [Chlamydomonas schloesseri]|uniref:Uncharacterized protein n=1 Tax=Chlamydomonas schloesseri TaxID=2026947 RepID=A0A835TKC9_9CHLO|nr:hypothetical protein HYH02_009618 [Chlamydomonas schloesseri]|eukprot:KAG2442129.1 hypothetical protein HYH02_009618 [Chlamydomonas schloesseri]